MPNVPTRREAFIKAYDEALLGDHPTMATSPAHTLKPLPAWDLSFCFVDASDEPPWAIMKRANRWKAKSVAVHNAVFPVTGSLE